jgi:two-component system CheB/CheR fusion protein
MAVSKESRRQAPNFPVVGIGASAGGISALRGLFKSLPRHTGLAFVVVQHLHPDHPNQLAALLEKATPLPVCEAADGMKVEPDHVYVIAPGKELTLEKGRLQCRSLGAERAGIDSIDAFLESLATDRGQQAIAVVLSGTGSDGTAGALHIKQAGGLVFVQNPPTAQYDGMPRAAIAAGAASHILPVEAIAHELMGRPSPASVHPAPDRAEDEDARQPLDEILTLIRLQAGFDLSGYKFKPLLWQIQQRMKVRGIEHFDDYEDLLHDDPAELEALLRNIPIHVTEFFRDPEAWDVLAREVIAPLALEQAGNRPLRIWTPACSSGEEAYSVAMLLAEQASQMDKPANFQIFATDASFEIVARASRGQFSNAAIESISPERKARFFYAADGAYRAKKSLREKMVFAPQHLLADPPFSDLDLVTCRNLLIYLEPSAQQRLLSQLHASLRMGGYLFLGSGESLSSKQRGFEAVSSRWHIYRKTGPAPNIQIKFPKRLEHLRHAKPTQAVIEERAHWAVLEKFDLPSVLVDEQFNILRVYGNTAPFLRLPPGEPTLNLIQVAKPTLVTHLWIAADRAVAERRAVIIDGLWDDEAGNFSLRMRLTPLQSGENSKPTRLLVSFLRSMPSPDLASIQDRKAAPTVESASEQGSQHWKDALQISIEELEASREELQALNEELKTVNDQLNISNEEVNQVNAQLHAKIQELETQSHVLSSGAVMTLFLDEELRIRWFTTAISELFPLMAYDTGRKITELVPKFDDFRFIDDVHAVMRTGEPLEGEVRNFAGRWFLRRIGPFRTDNKKTTGVAITFTDITERKQAEEALRESEHQFRALTTATSEVLYRMNADWTEMQVLSGGGSFINPNSSTRDWLEKYVLPEDQPHVLAAIRQAMATKSVFELEHRVRRTDGASGWTLSRAVPLLNAKGEITEWFGAANDVTARKEAEEALIASENRLQLALLASKGGAWDWDMTRDVATVSDSFRELYGLPPDQPISYEVWLGRVHPDDRERCRSYYENNFRTGMELKMEFRILHPKRGILWLEGIGRLEYDAEGRPVRVVGINLDITERKQVEEALRESEERLRLAWKATRDVIWDWDIVHDAQRWSVSGAEVFGWREAVDAPQTASWGLKLVHPEDRVRITADLRAVLDDPARDHWEDEYRFIRVDGSYADVFDRGFVIRDGQGKPIRMIGAMQDITDRKRTEEALRDSEHRLRRFYDSGLLGVIYWNTDGGIVDANDKFLEMVGYDREDLLAGRINWQQMTPPEYRLVDERAMREVQATGFNAVPFEKEYIRKDGARLPVIVAGAMLDEAHFNGVAFVLDITDRKRTEAALRESEDSLQFALETSNIGAWDLDLVERTAHRSLEHDRIFGYDQLLPEWTYEMFLEHVLPEDRSAVDKKFRDAMTTYSDWNFECRIRRADGEMRWIWAVGRHRADSSGKPRRMAGIVQDITAHKQRSPAETAFADAGRLDPQTNF